MAAVNKSKKLYLCGAPGLGRPNLVRGRASAGERVMVIRAQSRVENGNHHKGRNSSAAHCSKSGGYTAEASLVDNLIRINDSLKKENEALRIALSKIDKAELTRVLEKVETTKTTMTYPRTAMASSIPGTIFDEKERRNALKHKTRRRKKKELSAAYFKVDLDKIKWPSPSDSPPFWERTYPKANGEHVDTMADELNYTETMANGTVHTVIHVTAEMAPLAKVGGLGDAVAGLARSCLFAGHNVEVVLPFYESIDEAGIEKLKFESSFSSPYRDDHIRCEIFTGMISKTPVVLLKPENHFFKGSRIYGGSYNELEAYLFFCRAVLEMLTLTNRRPSIIHLHDWHTSAVAMLYWEFYHKEERLTTPRVVLTIHNMENSGECRDEEFNATGYDGSVFLQIDKALDERTIGHNPERLSLMKGGVTYSNKVSTVSPSYARETTHHGAAGVLGETLLKFDEKYEGILNGIDYELWNPATDENLPFHFNADFPEGKASCKRYLQSGLGLEVDPDAPLVACVTRLVPQKGIHLIKHAVNRINMNGKGQMVLLGSSPDGGINGDFQNLVNFLGHDHPRIRLCIMYSENLAHLMYAAADILLVPSMFEPCGLTQMIAMRYGAIPCVRNTGGLRDTVHDVDSSSEERSNGFVFDGIDEGSLDGALDRALSYYVEKRKWWKEMVKKVMRVDHSWSRSAGTYIELYNQAHQ